ncbi:MAG: hypothetical protein J6Y49_00925 [Alphaproteobacteria bacterium]|nr:hypothetical protein [Alphaproteobacteria bacterium]
MIRIEKFLAVSFIAMLAVSTANATVVTQSNIVGTNGVTVSVPESGDNAGKVQVKTVPAYGAGAGGAATVAKTVTIDGITSLEVGQVIYVKPATTSTVASSTLNLNGLGAKPMRYNNEAISTSTDSVVWNQNYVSIFVYDGTYWQFAGHGLDSNTTYSGMTAAEITAGTATTNRLISPANLKTAIETWAPETDISGKQDNLGGSGNDGKAVIASSTAGTVTYKAIDTTNGGTASSADLITSGAVNAGLAGKQATLSAAQLNAVNSGITSGKVSSYDSHVANDDIHVTAAQKTTWSGKQDDLTVMSVSEGQTGTATTERSMDAAKLKQIVQGSSTAAGLGQGSVLGPNYAKSTATGTNLNVAKTDTVNAAIGKLEKKADDAAAAAAAAASTASSHTHATSDVTTLGGYSKGTSSAALATSDTLNAALGKLENQIDKKVTANSAITAKSGNNLVSYDAKGLVTGSVAAGSLATKSAVASADITDGTIVNADISSSAAIDQSKISGLSTSLSGKVDKAQGTDNKDKVMITDATNGNVTTTAFVHQSGYNAQANDKDTTIPSVATVEKIVLDAAGDYVAFDQTSSNANKVMITNGSGKVVPVAITNDGTGVVTGVSISNGTVTVSKSAIGAANVASGLVTGTAPITVSRNSTSGVYTVAATAGSVADGNTGLINGDKVYDEVRAAQTSNGTGYLGAPASTTTATNLTNLDTAIKTIHPNTGEVKIPSGSETSSTLASIWVE